MELPGLPEQFAGNKLEVWKFPPGLLTLFDKVRALAHKLRKDGTDVHVIYDDLGGNPAIPDRGRNERELYLRRRAQLLPVWFRY